MRQKLVHELVKEVLGPRTNDTREIISVSPYSEFITGILVPKGMQESPEIDDNSDIPTEYTDIKEDENTETEVESLPVFQPALDPKSRPSTMGISFVIEYDSIPPILQVCLTWARYHSIEGQNGKVSKWKREPKFSILNINGLNSTIYSFDNSGNPSTNTKEISLYVKSSKLTEKSLLLNFYIVNEIVKPSDLLAISDFCIYQPQIRVCRGNTKIIQGVKRAPTEREEQTLDVLYRERPVYARGHLCSAMWKDIDPQASQDNDTFERGIPFYWLDGEQLLEKKLYLEHKKFLNCDVRTEYIPIYTIANPKLEWDKRFGVAPELKAISLAEAWDPAEIRQALSPIADGFSKWINGLEERIVNFPDSEKLISLELISQCKIVLTRIKDGINLLCNNEEARLSFCFANKAIDKQGTWSRKKEFVWRPFQLAFILMTIESITDSKSKHRNSCDILWVPTGTGKTEAYLALVAFIIAYRRRRSQSKLNQDLTGAGVSVITRYTLRLLAIQQFRRTLTLITACEYLRVFSLGAKTSVGWRPKKYLSYRNFIWGSVPFACGLWVGTSVSPNRLKRGFIRETKHLIPGALDILEGISGEGEPAQILDCPACGNILAVPEIGLQTGIHEMHFIVKLVSGDISLVIGLLTNKIFGNTIIEGKPRVFSLESPSYYTISLKFRIESNLIPRDLDSLWEMIHDLTKTKGVNLKLASIRASRSGYFERVYGASREAFDFEIFCTNPDCELNTIWVGGLPSGWIADNSPHALSPSPDGHSIPCFPDGNRLIDIQDPFRKAGNVHVSNRIPIPALMVEDQIFRRLPSVLVATVDKFARPPFKPDAASLFGNVQFHNSIHGYHRETAKLKTPLGNSHSLAHPLQGPDLIIQDELHLIEGPLGSLVGLYETAIDYLCKENSVNIVKYIASTATIRRAKDQTQALFCRDIQIFPSHGLFASDRFFLSDQEIDAIDDKTPGRLYLGICAPGRGPLTPLVRIYSRLLLTVGNSASDASIDDYWTLTGYFNAIRELGGARALYRQDIPQRLDEIARLEGISPRLLDDANAIELSSRKDATDLPAILRILEETHYPIAPDVLFTTSMFGTGIDISRIGLMVVNGQPKTTSSYIQSTGRVGRRNAALVVTFLRASRPRDLNHYEFFAGYHRQLHRYVEPATVYPFSPGAMERALGPVIVFILRNMRRSTIKWSLDNSAVEMSTQLTKAREIIELPNIFETRAQNQPRLRRPLPNKVSKTTESKLAVWHSIASLFKNLVYNEYTKTENPVVLGDFKHLHAKKEVVYENAPQSLRDIEETTSFQTGG